MISIKKIVFVNIWNPIPAIFCYLNSGALNPCRAEPGYIFVFKGQYRSRSAGF